ncbi:MAG: protein-disulfide reductase DsbD family protein [Planctomycetota bacterium]|jgi:thiol:disulfide interchange protein
MRKKVAVMLWIVCIFAVSCCAWAEDTSTVSTPAIELARDRQEYSSAHIETARMGSKPGIAVVFEGTKDLHYYARAETVPARGFELKVAAKSEDFGFGEAVYPKWSIFSDPLGKEVEVYAARFTVFLPIKTVKAPTKTTTIEKGDVEVKISGIACTSRICLPPFEQTLRATIDYSGRDSWKEITFERAGSQDRVIEEPSYSLWFALGLAFLAGLALNIMPCVWPVLPIIVMRIVEHAKQSKGRSIAMGVTFCLGILLFFACLAGANIILQVFYGTVLQWGDHFRNPAFVTGMALLLVVLALFMFGLFTITIPSSIAGKSGSGKGYPGALGMGFLAAILSTPCSFGILAAAFAWAQGQRLILGTLAIMVIGAGMAAPYAILTSMPGLLKRLPKAGRWMEIFKQALGFVLLIIAVKMIKALPDANKISVLYFAVVLSFCFWMWGSWVGYGSSFRRKLFVRGLAVVLAVLAFGLFFAKERIEWQQYDAKLIDAAKAEGKPVLIKFTADWCLNCEVVDMVVYQRKDIGRLIEDKGVLAVKADATRDDQPATRALKEIYNEPGVPVTILLVPGREKPIRFQEISFAKKLKQALKRLPSKQQTNGKKSEESTSG